MANSDSSQYAIRYNEISGVLEFGSGNTWTTIALSNAGGTPAGTNGQLQYNNAGAFGASALFTVDPTAGHIQVGNSSAFDYGTVELRSTGFGGQILASDDTGGTQYSAVVLSSNGEILLQSEVVGSGSRVRFIINNNGALPVSFANDYSFNVPKNLTAGNATPDASAVLQADSNAQGFLPPRMTTTQRDAIATPAEGLVIYNSTTHVLNFYNGTTWGAV